MPSLFSQRHAQPLNLVSEYSIPLRIRSILPQSKAKHAIYYRITILLTLPPHRAERPRNSSSEDSSVPGGISNRGSRGSFQHRRGFEHLSRILLELANLCGGIKHVCLLLFVGSERHLLA